MTAYERSNWRDSEISARHRKWGFNCPAVDMDFLLLEYNHGIPVAVVDYKHHEKADPFEGLHESAIEAQSGLYDKHGKQLPFFVARYWPSTWAMKALPMNDAAKVWLPADHWRSLTERQWVYGLYRLREIALTAGDKRYLDRLNTTPPPPETEVA